MRSRVFLGFLLAATFGCFESTPFDDDGPDAPGESAAEADGEATAEAEADAGDVPDETPFCGDEKEPRTTLSRIVDGVESFDPSVVLLTEGQVLAVGAMMQRDWRTGSFSNACTATLVTDITVLTAAHCLSGWMGTTRPSDVRFAVGRDIADPVHVFEIAEVHVHPDYRGSGGGDQARHDQAVMILAESAAAAVPDIQPIPINRLPLPDAFLGTVVQNVGYGTTEPGGGGSNTLRWWTTETVTEISDFDYTVYGGGVSSVCFGDSGGPGMWTFPDDRVRVQGTVSWGDPSCMDYDHFARTDDNIEFLLPYVGEEDPCGGLTWEGRCEGDDAVWCVDGVTYRRDCAACGQTCGDAGPSWGWYCV
ncbi:MAG: trypsin-like serine protease [Deltaproteobacteria bacterium]|nr:trypsin-like serine protease [Deltaproteobacteria bacterium]